MRYWLPRKGDRVVPQWQPLYPPVTLLRRLGVWDEENEHWEGVSSRGNRVTVAVGLWWVRCEK